MRVLLLAGGESSEREVSLNSGRAIFEALKGLGHDVLAVDPATGRSLLGHDGCYLLSSDKPVNPDSDSGTALALSQALSREDSAGCEVVFVALHGGAGENGSIQSVLDLAGMPYVGSGMAASAVAMDKALSKTLCQAKGITTPRWRLFRVPEGRITSFLYDEISKEFTPPYIVKPNDSGSTVGLTRVDKPEQLTEALVTVLGESTSILVEDYIPGRELTVAVLDGVALPVVEIVPQSGLYDYEAKYTKGKSQYICPAKIADSTAQALQRAAATMFEMIGASGLARVDFILSQDQRPFFLEVNTLPGMTELSLAPMAARAAGISFEQLVQRLVESAVRRPGR